ncbi:transposase [Crocosphaera sp. Alani8]|uniref:transposase n=1 Tax=Crocosphaera sp. Alani8 TaxID=3038952 RepID=UPI00313B53E8
MTSPLAIKAKIAQLRASGVVAEPHTWISATSVTKNGKKYIYYRLLKGFRVKSGKEDQQSHKPKLKTKMVSYLGSANSEAYKEMVKAIARRNEIQRLLKKLETLEKQVNADNSKPRKSRKPVLTTLVMELMAKFEQLQEEMLNVKMELEQYKKLVKL